MIEISTLVGSALETAWSLAAEALTACTLKVGPTTAIVMETEVETTTWQSETTLDALIFGEKQAEESPSNRDDRGARSVGWEARAILRASDLPSGIEPRHDSVLVAGATLWHVSEVEKIPTNAIFILKLQR